MKSQCVDEGTLRAYIDGELATAESMEVGEHIQGCAVCRLSLSEQQLVISQVSGLLKSYLRVSMPTIETAFESAVVGSPISGLSKVKASREQVNEVDRPVRLWEPRRGWLAMGMGVAALACLVLLAFVLPGFLRAQGDVSAPDLPAGSMIVSVSQPSDKEFTPFVPAGKVRHIVVDYITEYTGVVQPASSQSVEVWLANGQEHLLMRKITQTVGAPPQYQSEFVVNDEAAWYYNPAVVVTYDGSTTLSDRQNDDGAVGYRMDYSPEFLAPYVPDPGIISDLLEQSNTQVTGNGTLDDRPYELVESLGNVWQGARIDRLSSLTTWSTMPVLQISKLFADPDYVWVSRAGSVPPGVHVTPEPSLPPIVTLLTGIASTHSSNVDYSLWVDSETGRVLQAQAKTRIFMTGDDGTTETEGYERQTMKIRTDELLDVSQVSSDLFAFSVPEGRQVDRAVPVFVRLVAPGTTTGEQSSWQVYRSPDGDSMAVMPGEDGIDSQSDGWHLHTTILSDLPITFTVGYRDLDISQVTGDEHAMIESELATVVSRTRGIVLASGVVMLDGHAGKEVTIRGGDNAYTRMRVFLVGSRMYEIYASAPDNSVLTFVSGSYGSSYGKYDVGVGTFLTSLTLLSK